MVLDSYPGDICVIEQEWGGQDGPDFVASFLLSYADLDDGLYPDSGLHQDQTYWSFDGTNWCYPQDPVPGLPPGMREDLNGEPLHLYVITWRRRTLPSTSLCTRSRWKLREGVEAILRTDRPPGSNTGSHDD
jgi:hypothetical protein